MVSVIIPIYNTEKYLKDCIESVLRQTIRDYEIILINDGSTDKSIEIAEKYCDKYNNISLINQTNRGQGAARNVGIASAKGEYLYFLDSDDMIEDNMLEICLKKIVQNNLDIVFFGHKYFYESDLKKIDKTNDVYVNTWIGEDEVLDGKEFFRREISTNRINPSIWRQMYKKSFICNNGLKFSEDVFSEDIEFFVKVLMRAHKVMNLQEALYIWRKRSNSTTTGKVDFKRINSLGIILCKLFDIFSKECSKDELMINSAKRFLKHHIQILTDKMREYTVKDKSYIVAVFNKNIKEFRKLFEKYLCENDYCFWAEQLIKISNISEDLKIENIVKEMNYEDSIICIDGLKRIDIVKNEILKKIPIEKEEKIVGIYGIGQHTISLLNYYRQNIGKVKCDIIFIDSFKGFNNEKFLGRPVININNINNYKFDCIVISSFGSEEKMYNNLVVLLKEDIEIVKIYNKKYDFSLFV